MKVEALTTSAPSPGSDIPAFRAGDKFDVTEAEFKKLSAAGAVRSLEPTPPASIDVKKPSKKADGASEAAGDKTTSESSEGAA